MERVSQKRLCHLCYWIFLNPNSTKSWASWSDLGDDPALGRRSGYCPPNVTLSLNDSVNAFMFNRLRPLCEKKKIPEPRNSHKSCHPLQLSPSPMYWEWIHNWNYSYGFIVIEVVLGGFGCISSWLSVGLLSSAAKSEKNLSLRGLDIDPCGVLCNILTCWLFLVVKVLSKIYRACFNTIGRDFIDDDFRFTDYFWFSALFITWSQTLFFSWLQWCLLKIKTALCWAHSQD